MLDYNHHSNADDDNDDHKNDMQDNNDYDNDNGPQQRRGNVHPWTFNDSTFYFFIISHSVLHEFPLLLQSISIQAMISGLFAIIIARIKLGQYSNSNNNEAKR